MPNFRYSVRDRSGKAIAGTIDAPTLQNAGERLYQLGYFPILIEEEGKALFPRSIVHLAKIPRGEIGGSHLLQPATFYLI